MPSQNQEQRRNVSEENAFSDETTPIVDPQDQLAGWKPGLSRSQHQALCTFGVLSLIAVVYWVMDGWNREVAGNLFQTKIVEVDASLRVNMSSGFANPLLLTVLQFGFMSLAFFGLWALHAGGAAVTEELQSVAPHLTGKRWLGLAGCHTFSTFWLQSLMMPATMMGIGAFAAVRAVEIPAAAVFRGQLLGAPMGKHTTAQAGLAFAGAWLVVYSYSMIGNCICIFSGQGVPLSGAALYLVWAMLLTLPAAHAVLEEGAMKQMGHHPLAVLGMQNGMALILSLPVLVAAHLLGWEDVLGGMSSLFGMPQIRMMALWLCVQMCVLSAARVGFTYIANSFWSVSLRALKAAFTWFREVAFLSVFAAGTSLSMQHPHASTWSFFMLCGILLVVGAAYVDTTKDSAGPELPGKFQGLGIPQGSLP